MRRRVKLAILLGAAGGLMVIAALACRWEDLAERWYERELRVEPASFLAFLDAEAESMRGRALSKFLRSAEGKERLVEVVFCELEPMRFVLKDTSLSTLNMSLEPGNSQGGSDLETRWVIQVTPGTPIRHGTRVFERFWDRYPVEDSRVERLWPLLPNVDAQELQIPGGPGWEILIHGSEASLSRV